MLAKEHQVLGIVTDRRPVTALDRTFGKPPNLPRQAWTLPLHRLLLVDSGFGGA